MRPSPVLVAVDDALDRLAADLTGTDGDVIRSRLGAVREMLARGESSNVIAAVRAARDAVAAAVDPVTLPTLAAITLALDAADSSRTRSNP
jgi:hypothetical protein